MKISIDGQPHLPPHAAPRTVAEVLGHVDQLLESQGRAIQGVSIDGKSIELRQLVQDMHDLAVAEIEALDIRTSDTTQLVRESLREVAPVINELSSACHTLAALLCGPEREQALGKYAEFAEVWGELLLRHRQAAALVHTKIAASPVNARTLSSRDDKVNALLTEGANRAKDADAVGLADLLGYELSEAAEEEAVILETLLGALGDATA